MPSIATQYQILQVLNQAHKVTDKVREFQCDQVRDLEHLNDLYRSSASLSRRQAVATIIATLVLTGGCSMASPFFIQSNAKDILSLLGKNGGDLAQAAQKCVYEPDKLGLDGRIQVLNQRYTAKQGEGPSSAKQVEESIQQALATSAQLFEKALVSG